MEEARKLCETIREFYPEIGECGSDVDVKPQEYTGDWTVSLADSERISTIKKESADACLEADRCADVAVKVLDLLEDR